MSPTTPPPIYTIVLVKRGELEICLKATFAWQAQTFYKEHASGVAEEIDNDYQGYKSPTNGLLSSV